MRLALLSNVNLDLLHPVLAESFQLYSPAGFGQWVQECIAPSEGLTAFAPDVFALLLDGTALVEAAPDPEAEIDAALRHVERLAQTQRAARVFVSTIDVRPVKVTPADALPAGDALAARWASGLTRLVSAFDNVHLFDLARLVAEHGRSQIYSDKMWYLGSVPFNLKATTIISEALLRRITSTTTPRKKVLVVDLDNTLWGGVLGEDGMEGIILGGSLHGAAYRDAQLRIRELAQTGILLAIVSKNDEDLVLEALREHPQMVLREGDFAAIKANWRPKHKNIIELAEDLNLGLDSFVFLDDNPVEREAVRIEVPEVSVVGFPKDVSRLPRVVAGLFEDYFFAERLTAEDAARTEQYRAEARRQVAKATAGSLEDYLATLDIAITLGHASEQQLARTAQLTGKTNQFNLRTARYSVEELTAYRAQPGNHIFVASVSDRYGDNGLVFVLMVSTQPGVATIDNLLMSCRVMGRHIEDAIVAAVEERLSAEGVSHIRGVFIPTARNTPVRDLLDRLGYQRVGEGETLVEYERAIGSAAPGRLQLHTVAWVGP